MNARLCLIPLRAMAGDEALESSSRVFRTRAIPSQLISDGFTVSISTWRSGRESNTLVALATRRRSRSMPYRSATTPNAISSRPFSRRKTRRCPDRESARGGSTSNGTCQRAAQEPHARTSGYDSVFKGRIEPDVHDRARGKAWGDRRDSNSFRSLHKRVPRPLRLRPPCRPGTNRTPVTRFGIAIVATTRTRTNERGDRLRADPLVKLTGVSERLRCGDPGLRARDD